MTAGLWRFTTDYSVVVEGGKWVSDFVLFFLVLHLAIDEDVYTVKAKMAKKERITLQFFFCFVIDL